MNLRKIPEFFQCAPKDKKKQWPCRIVKATNPKTKRKVMLLIPRDKGKIAYRPNQKGTWKWWFIKAGKTTAGTPYEPLAAKSLSDGNLKAIEFARSLKGKPVDRAMECLRQNALFVLNLSGGKDSQAMWLYLTRQLKIPKSNIFAIHADLPGADWPRTRLPSGRITPSVIDHIKATIDAPVDVVVARWASGEVKTFDSMVRHAREAKGVRHPFPSPKIRQCTSDLKRGPIKSATLTKLCERNGLPVRKGGGCGNVEGRPWRIVINCIGIRAQESWGRESELEWSLDIDNSTEGRAWFTWNPILKWKTDQVFAEIFKYGQEPFWTYGMTDQHMGMIRERYPQATRGMERLSCQFCIMASRHDLTTAAHLAPTGYARRCDLEDQMDSAMLMGGKRLPELTGVIPVKELLRRRRNPPNPWEGLATNPWATVVMNPQDVELAQALLGRTNHSAQLRNGLVR